MHGENLELTALISAYKCCILGCVMRSKSFWTDAS
jgi:hypothetical protein